LTDIEGYNPKSIKVVGNLIVDTYHLYEREIKKSNILEKIGLKHFGVLTLHRQENVDKEENLSKILMYISRCKENFVFPVHPRTEKRLKRFYHKLPKNILFMRPIGYFDFMKLLLHSSIIITDSGGVQEEAITLKKPCITLRKNTERWKTVFLLANTLFDIDSGHNLNEIIYKMKGRINYIETLDNPYGDGNTSVKIISFLKKIAQGC
jgi:UDP-N-acetylglucosamine 2-epimerase